MILGEQSRATFAKRLFLYFAHRVRRQGVQKYNCSWLLELGEIVLGRRRNGAFGQCIVVARDHRNHGFAKVGVGDTIHGTFTHDLNIVDQKFDFLWTDVVAARDDQVISRQTICT